MAAQTTLRLRTQKGLGTIYSVCRVLAAERLHGDDTTLPVLAKSLPSGLTRRGKTDTGGCWVRVRDDRPFGSPKPPAAMFHYSRDLRRLQPPR